MGVLVFMFPKSSPPPPQEGRRCRQFVWEELLGSRGEGGGEVSAEQERAASESHADVQSRLQVWASLPPSCWGPPGSCVELPQNCPIAGLETWGGGGGM